MKNTGIHILDFNDKIIDYISRDDGALLNAVMSTNADEKSETFDFTMLNDRAENLRERNRLIAQDNNGIYREFIITHVVDNFDGTTDVESNASYLEDIDKSKPIKPGQYKAYSTSQALNETLRNTGWEMSDDTEYGGMRTTSWTAYSTPYEVINMLCTTYSMVADYSIELGSHTVEHRYVTLKKPVSLFKGKEITKGKYLTGMTRTVDMSEVRTALYAIGPENDTGQRLEKIVTDDDAQAQFGLPGRYLWSVYEPESDDSNMTDERLTTLAKTELNKRNKSAISYEITSTDIHKHYPEMVVSLHDTVRIKDRDFRPPLYIEAEVIGVDYDLLQDESTYKFGNVVEYDESSLRDIFNKKLADISKKLNDNVSNINTIVNDVVAGQLEYFERKIFKQDTPPENPVNDMLWYDTSNPNVAVLRRYWNGEWLNETVDDVEKIGGITREKALLSELQNTFANLSIQHSKILNDTNEVLNSEYLVDTDLKNKLQTEMNNIDEIYLSSQSDLKAMTPDTATIGALIDIQSQFSSYRQKLQDLYKALQNAKISADKRLKLLQSQYTDQKFNDALNKVASKFGLTVDSNNNMVGTPDVIEKAIQASREDTQEQLKSYVKSVDYQTDKDGIVQRLDGADSERLQLSNQISDKVSLSEYNQNKEDTETQLTTMDTSISQNGQDIQQRATKEELNSSKKTLSKVISDFTNNVATGMTFTYDENGAIQLMNIGSDGIKLKGDRVDITVNKDFNVVTQTLNNKVGKDEVVNRLNLSKEGLDINVNNLGIRGGNNSEYIDIRNTSILSYGSFTRTWANVTDTAKLKLGMNKGTIQVSNTTTGYNLYLTEKGLSTMLAGAGDETAGTLEFHSQRYNETSRGVTLHSTYGAVALASDNSRVILDSNLTVNIESQTSSVYIRPMKDNRTGTNEFRFWVKNNDTGADTDGVLSYGLITGTNNSPYDFGSGIRFDKSPKSNYVYATDKDGNIGTGDFYARNFLGDWWAKGTNLYGLVNNGGELRITDRSGYNKGNPNYQGLAANEIRAGSIRTLSGNLYIGVSTDKLRVTNNLLYNGGNIGYRPIEASDFIKASRVEYKEDIEYWNFDALSIIVNDLDLYSYKYKEDLDKTTHHGPVIGDGYNTPEEFIIGNGINTNEMLSYSIKAIQQLNEKLQNLEEQINGK
ncbi:phage tail spike protein [Staphylococcus pasteuri]|uniref:phage tail spike protein n=1 Tax=Staphylococcus pasteuri TaxID=45972 RepID=UPI00325FEEB4